MKTIHLISLGCAKNLVDSERLLASAMTNYKLKPIDDPAAADLILINTCAFLQSAAEEALAVIMEAGAAKKEGALLAVAGCLPSRYLGENARMADELPEVDLWLPPAEYHLFEEKLAPLLGSSSKASKAFEAGALPLGGRTRGAPFFRAFLKISEGCDNRCSYCLIPRLRGPLKSYDADILLAEAEALAADGVRELTLVAQDLTAYGRDRGEEAALLSLTRRLSDIRGLSWLRLLYAYPERVNERLIKDLADTPKVVPYLDLPFQHVSADILKRMGRRQTRPLELVKNLRRWWPGLAIRSTLIVGFPGETETHFHELQNFVEEAALDHLGVFKFSPEEEAPASRYPDQIPRGLKEKRRRRIMSIQRTISLAHNRARVGQTVPVLAEGPSPDSDLLMIGRAPFQAPEVDGLIYFDGEQPKAGQIVNTRLMKAGPYDLLGRVVGIYNLIT